MIKLAKDLEVGDVYKAESSIQMVKKIVSKNNKTVTYETRRIHPNPYDGDFFHRKRLTTKLELIDL